MKSLLAEKEAVMKKVDVLGKKVVRISASLQTVRAYVRDANSKKRNAAACLKSSIEAAQPNLSTAQMKNTAAINHLEKQSEEKLSQYSNSHKCDIERQKVIVVVSLICLLWHTS